MLSRTLTIIALVFLLVALCMAGLGWYFYRAGNPHLPAGGFQVSSQLAHEQPSVLLPCGDITQGCGNGKFNIRFDRRPQVMQPFDVVLELADSANDGSQQIHASFAMTGMQMGLSRYRFVQQTEDKTWRANVTLPVCVQGKSVWNMQLEFKSLGGTEIYRLIFESPGPSH